MSPPMGKSRGGIWLEATRPKTLPAAVAPVLIGSALAWHDRAFDWMAATLCLVFAVLIQIGTNFANDYYDFVKGADTADRVGPRRAVAAGLISPRVMYRAMIVILTIAFSVGLCLVAWGGPWLILIGVVSVVCAIAYTGGPYPLGYNGLGDVFVLVFFGPVAVGATYFVQAGSWGLAQLVWALAPGLLAANILVANNYRDVDTDRLAGKRTTVVRFGRGFARIQFKASLGLSLLIPVIFSWHWREAWLLLPGVLAPWAWQLARRLDLKKSPAELILLLGDSAKFLALYALLCAAGLILARA